MSTSTLFVSGILHIHGIFSESICPPRQPLPASCQIAGELKDSRRWSYSEGRLTAYFSGVNQEM